MKDIFDWIIQDSMRTAWIAWLYGAAGAGKSAIAQSVAEACIIRGILVASFFFFRMDPMRNTMAPLVATLAYQIMQLLPDSKKYILEAIENNPLVFEQSLDAQFALLIIEPLRILQLFMPCKLVLVIDGVDECIGEADQTNLIRVLGRIPLLVLICSRAEYRIKMAFNVPAVDRILKRLPLDDNYLADHDVAIFLNERFREIHQTHPMSHLLHPAWPAPALVQEITEKSSGQFIYASVVLKFVSLPRFHPEKQLEIVCGLRASGSSTPFAELDALYRHIFSQVQNLPLVIGALAYIIIGHSYSIARIAHFFGIAMRDVDEAMADLVSVADCSNGKVRFLHASLPDFLLNRTRSEEYHIDYTEWSTRLSVLWLRNVNERRFSGKYRILQVMCGG